jgi:hypothetical protein
MSNFLAEKFQSYEHTDNDRELMQSITAYGSFTILTLIPLISFLIICVKKKYAKLPCLPSNESSRNTSTEYLPDTPPCIERRIPNNYSKEPQKRQPSVISKTTPNQPMTRPRSPATNDSDPDDDDEPKYSMPLLPSSRKPLVKSPTGALRQSLQRTAERNTMQRTARKAHIDPIETPPPQQTIPGDKQRAARTLGRTPSRPTSTYEHSSNQHQKHHEELQRAVTRYQNNATEDENAIHIAGLAIVHASTTRPRGPLQTSL